MPLMFTNRCSDIFSTLELADMHVAMVYKVGKALLNFEAYMTALDKALAARISYVPTPQTLTTFNNPNHVLKYMCFDTIEYDRRIAEKKHESQLLRKADMVIKKYKYVQDNNESRRKL